MTGQLMIMTNQVRTSLNHISFLTCKIQAQIMLSIFSGKTFFVNQNQVLSATAFDIQKITRAELQSKLAHSLLRTIEPTHLIFGKIITIHKTDTDKSCVAFQCFSEITLLIDNVPTKCNNIDIKWFQDPKLVTINQTNEIIDQHLLYKSKNLTLDFHGLLKNKVKIAQHIFSKDLHKLSQMNRLKLFIQKSSYFQLSMFESCIIKNKED